MTENPQNIFKVLLCIDNANLKSLVTILSI